MVSQGIAIFAVAAAVWSALMAFLSWQFNRELNKAAISLISAKVKHERISREALKINFTFTFKNVGRETAWISELRLGQINLEGDVFEQKVVNPMLNPMHTESALSYSIAFTKSIDPQTTDNDLKTHLPAIVGKTAIIVILKDRRKWTKFYSLYQGTGIINQLNQEQYRAIEKNLPKEFKAE